MVVSLGIPKPRAMDPLGAKPSVSTRPSSEALIDQHGRTAVDVRISLTDFCNLRCTYCMPAEGMQFLPKADLLSTAEVVRLARIAVHELGAKQLRFTGGEPLTRPDLVEIIEQVAALEPRPDISLTTNAIGFENKAEKLKAAGLDRINISLDSVNADTFNQIARRPLFHRVVAGIEAAREAGFKPIKINAVLQPGINDHEASELLTWCLERGLQLRFIEYMPLDGAGRWEPKAMVTAADVQKQLEEHFRLSPASEPRAGAPAELFDVFSDSRKLGQVGIIASVTRPFCRDCTRTRVTAEGRIRTCLFSHQEVDLLKLLRSDASDQEVADLWRAAQWNKQAGHGMDKADFVQPMRPMSAIGG